MWWLSCYPLKFTTGKLYTQFEINLKDCNATNNRLNHNNNNIFNGIGNRAPPIF